MIHCMVIGISANLFIGYTYCMVGRFCGVQTFVDFSSHLIHEKLLNFSYITK